MATLNWEDERDRRRRREKDGDENKRRGGGGRERKERERDDDGRERRRRRRRRSGSSGGSDGGGGGGKSKRPHNEPITRGFRPAPWMGHTGPRPGEHTTPADGHPADLPPPDNETKPIIQLCRLPWDDEDLMNRRVGYMIPLATAVPLSDRFEAVRREAEKAERKGEKDPPWLAQLKHLANLQVLGVPVGLIYEDIDSWCQENGVETHLPDVSEDEADPAAHEDRFGGMKGGKGKGKRREDRIVENEWPELPWKWATGTTMQHVNNAVSTVLLVALIPPELNTEENLKNHFSRYGTVTQVIPRINFRPYATRFAKQGLALVEMAVKTQAAIACNSADPVCDNRFVKVFYAPDPVREKVERMRINKMMQERSQAMEKNKEKAAKRQAAERTLQETKMKILQLTQQQRELKIKLNDATDPATKSTLLAEQQDVVRSLHKAYQQQLEMMDILKATAPSSVYRPQTSYGNTWVAGKSTFKPADSRTCAFKLPNLPPTWVQSPTRLRRAMERYGEVLGSVVAGSPAQGFVKFKRRFEAERAVRALEENHHKTVWVDHEAWETAWVPGTEVPETEDPTPVSPPKPVVVQDTEDLKDDDDALVEAEFGLRNDEIIPPAPVEGMETDEGPPTEATQK